MSRPTVARAAKPTTIYRRGKPAGEQRHDDPDDSDVSEEEAPVIPQQAKLLSAADKRLEGFTIREDTVAKPALDLDLKLRAPSRSVVAEGEEDVKPSLTAPRRPLESVAPSSVKPPGDESSEYETATSEDEGSSDEEEEAARPMFKPTFVRKGARQTVGKSADVIAAEADEAYERDIEERKRVSHQLAGQAVVRSMADKETEEKFPDVDDTDGLDPEGDFEAWKLRELQRLRRDTEALYAREKEREELEARRALPESIRLKDDLAYAQSTRDNKSRGQQVFMQKYHHRGVFYTQDEITQRDTTAPTESAHLDVASLPQAMQVRQGKFGKRGQTKYTHLMDQDTSKKDAGWSAQIGGGSGRFGATGASGGASGGCFQCGGPHLKRDCPELANGGPTGANADIGYADRLRDDPRRDGGDGDRSRRRSPPDDRDRDKRRRLD